jgi:hypothetical protein
MAAGKVGLLFKTFESLESLNKGYSMAGIGGRDPQIIYTSNYLIMINRDIH